MCFNLEFTKRAGTEPEAKNRMTCGRLALNIIGFSLVLAIGMYTVPYMLCREFHLFTIEAIEWVDKYPVMWIDNLGRSYHQWHAKTRFSLCKPRLTEKLEP